MPTTSKASLPYPAGGDAPYAAADMQALAEAADTRVVLRASDAANRDARYASPSAGLLVVADDGTTWVADTSGAWHTVYQPVPAWINVALEAGYTAYENTPQVRIIGTHVWMRGGIQKTDSSAMASYTTLGHVPTAAVPSVISRIPASTDLGGDRTYTVCYMSLFTNGALQFSDQDPNGSPAYVKLDGIDYWVD